VSVYDSYNRFLSVHETDNLHVNGLVGDDTFGHGFMLEDGVEIGNVFTNNLVMRVHRPPEDANIAATKTAYPDYPICPTTNPTTFFSNNPANGKPSNASCRILISDDTPAGYWITNPSNTFSNNVSAGSDGVGIWYDFNYNSDNKCLELFTSGQSNLLPASMASRCGGSLAQKPFGPYINATAHSTRYPCDYPNSAEYKAVCGNGGGITFATNCIGAGFCIEGYQGNPANRGIINSPTAWMNDGEGMWFDGAATINNPMVANNKTGMTNQSSYVKGGLLIATGTGAEVNHNIPGGVIRFYHGQGDVDGSWVAGYATYNDSAQNSSPVAGVIDNAASAWDGNNRLKGLKFFDRWPNATNAPIIGSYRISLSYNGCNATTSINFTGIDHWVQDLDGSIKGDGVPATFTNNEPFLRPVHGTDNVGDNLGNTTCNKPLGINGGVFERSGGQTILYPNVLGIGTWFQNDNGFWSPGLRNFFKVLQIYNVKKIVRASDGMFGYPDGHAIAVFQTNDRYELQNSTNTGFSSMNIDQEAFNPGKITYSMKWTPATAKVKYNGYNTSYVIPVASSLTGLDSSDTTSYYLDTVNHMLYLHINVRGTEAAFGDPNNLNNLSADGTHSDYYTNWNITQ
jgi:hypothetical protein